MKTIPSKHSRFKNPRQAFLFASSLFDSQEEFAKKCGVCQQTISKWKRKGVPIHRAISVEKAVNGAVSRADLHPNFFD